MAAYNIDSVQSSRRLRVHTPEEGSTSRRLGTQQWVQVAIFVAATDSIVLHDSNTFLWMSGDTGTELPGHLFDCNFGDFKDSRGICTKCQRGSWTTTSGATECKLFGELCKQPGYSYTPSNASGSNGACTACPIGRVWSRLGCQDCPQGRATASVGSLKCAVCVQGQYQSIVGQSACKNCTAGRYADKAGTVICAACRAGTFDDAGGQSECSRCPIGKLSSAAGTTICSSCGKHLPGSSTLFQGAVSPDVS